MNKTTQKVYQYLLDSYGSTSISGQQEFSPEFYDPDEGNNYIYSLTNKLPAIRGLDFMNGDFNGVVKRAKEWWNRGGLVTICWHTGMYGGTHAESLNDNPKFDRLIRSGTNENKRMLENWDKAALALQELRDNDIPVLWKPFHEPDGEWFWWGKGGNYYFKKLWKMMYERFTNVFGLDNLIWVQGYTTEVKKYWYVGDKYCDVIGSDTYDPKDPYNDVGWYGLGGIKTDRLRCYHETQALPTNQDLSTKPLWSYLVVWHTDILYDIDKNSIKEFYDNDKVITLDKLPKFI